ncbi:SDR family NAD(P)-dependent oxidoreductase [Neolewinella lacunae]|uniref:SDR family NAD(P)-dependent oxidoreductase n=1 Tax=Neolewinella lacunae TaxID=1517758 RepID=A0A923PFC2_9BACT|nr:SDR family NAD(P)-dependent oxidoreductase [Neolewinella lacunae]MBC6993032.1 SDR family NAD(P)-dependent oxidoreductase [Neolewinella lacunae]MDN3635854.1 SDR family NAD(P)-dependent oxidoreductase [Neolewinella lacunae]
MKAVGLITGASSGIGRALAHEHAKRQRDLVIVARREEELKELKAELSAKYGVQVRVIAKDLTAPGACQAIYDELKQEGIAVDYLFNNAGYGGHGNFHERDLATDLGMIDLNVKALVELTHLFLKDMVVRGRGKILQTSSTAGYMPGPLQAVYFATKAFVNSFTWAVAKEVENTGVTLTTLNPGAVATEFADTAELSDTDLFKSPKTPEYTAGRGYAAMEAGKLDEITEFGLKMTIKAGLAVMPLKMQLTTIYNMQKKQGA